MDSMQQMFCDYTQEHLQKKNVHILSQQNAVMGKSTYVNVFFCVCEALNITCVSVWMSAGRTGSRINPTCLRFQMVYWKAVH